MNEQDVIRKYFAPLARGVSLGRGVDLETFDFEDDAARLTIDKKTFALTTDMLCEGTHFLPRVPPAKLAAKALAVNVADLAGKGARPRVAFVNVAMPPSKDKVWLRGFARGLRGALGRYRMRLGGGDMNRGKTLAVSVLVIGEARHYISRLGAQVGDQVLVTGTIGDGWLGLRDARGSRATAARRHYETPAVPWEFGCAMGAHAGRAHAATDVSDGLWADAESLARSSGCGLVLDGARIPLSVAGRAHRGGLVQLLTGGDDYQILLTAPAKSVPQLMRAAKKTKTRLTAIGEVVRGKSVRVREGNGWLARPRRAGYDALKK